MGAGGVVGTGARGAPLPMDQRSRGRRFAESRGGFSLGITEGDPDERAMLKYIRDIGQGFDAQPPAGFRNVKRR